MEQLYFVIGKGPPFGIFQVQFLLGVLENCGNTCKVGSEEWAGDIHGDIYFSDENESQRP